MTRPLARAAALGAVYVDFDNAVLELEAAPLLPETLAIPNRAATLLAPYTLSATP